MFMWRRWRADMNHSAREAKRAGCWFTYALFVLFVVVGFFVTLIVTKKIEYPLIFVLAEVCLFAMLYKRAREATALLTMFSTVIFLIVWATTGIERAGIAGIVSVVAFLFFNRRAVEKAERRRLEQVREEESHLEEELGVKGN